MKRNIGQGLKAITIPKPPGPPGGGEFLIPREGQAWRGRGRVAELHGGRDPSVLRFQILRSCSTHEHIEAEIVFASYRGPTIHEFKVLRRGYWNEMENAWRCSLIEAERQGYRIVQYNNS